MRNAFWSLSWKFYHMLQKICETKIFCNCKDGCGSRYGCRKAGLQCSLACGQCNGQACLNALPYQSNVTQLTIMEPLTPKSWKNLRWMSLKTIMKTSSKFTSSGKTTMKRKTLMKIINCSFCTLYSIFYF